MNVLRTMKMFTVICGMTLAAVVLSCMILAVPSHAASEVINGDILQSLYSGSGDYTYTLSPLIAIKTSKGKYLRADTGSNFGNAQAMATSKKLTGNGKFYLQRCKDHSYALKSAVNRRYLTKEWHHKMRFESDFLNAEEKFSLVWNGYTSWKIQFKKDSKKSWVRVNDKGELELTDSKSKAEAFTLVLLDRNDYSKADLAALKSNEWHDISGSVGYWDVQEQVGNGDIYALVKLGYTAASYNDNLPNDRIVSIDNMECVVGSKKNGSTTEVLIAFQGTGGYNGANPGDMFQDFMSNLTSGISGGMHSGYKDMAGKLWNERSKVMLNGLGPGGSVSLESVLNKILSGDESVHLTLLGHSMGGAIAQCFAMIIDNNCSESAKAKFRKSVTGRTFEAALAMEKDHPEFKDWINLCVDTDTVPNGVVLNSILQKCGIHRLGRTIWLYDDEPDYKVDAVANIASYKHCLGTSDLPNGLLSDMKKKASLTSYTVQNIKNQTVTGDIILPDTVVKNGSKVLERNVDYYVTYSNLKNIGPVTATIRGIGLYKGTLKKNYAIVPKGTSLTSLKSGSYALTVKWKKQKSNTSGYQIQYSTSNKFPSGSTKSVTIGKNKTTSKKIKNLSAKKTYYVRVRTYKTVSGKKYFSGWSKVKSKKPGGKPSIAMPVRVKVYAYNYDTGGTELVDSAQITYNGKHDITTVKKKDGSVVKVSLSYRKGSKLKKTESKISYGDGTYQSVLKAEFNSKGLRSSRSMDGTTIKYEYDKKGRLTKSKGGGDTTSYKYSLKDGKIRKIQASWKMADPVGGMLSEVRLDTAGLVTAIFWDQMLTFKYTRSGGKIVKVTEYSEDGSPYCYAVFEYDETNSNSLTTDRNKYTRTINECCANGVVDCGLPYMPSQFINSIF